jgi:NADH:ubiquinone oxidoreductase subunit E
METIGTVLETLGLEGEGETKDGDVTLRYNTCLGACAQGPVISVDHQLIGRLSPDGAREAVRFSISPGVRGEQHPPVGGV